MPWTTDGLSHAEESLIEQLLFLYVENTTPAALSLLDMPFLQTADPGDLQAVTALARLSQEHELIFQQVLNHPTFSSTGITNAWTPIISVLPSAAGNNPTLVPVLLDTEQSHLETQTITTTLSDAITLNIIRTATHFDRESMERLRLTVYHIESFTGIPFPSDTVNMLYAEAIPAGSAGVHYHSGITVLPTYDSHHKDPSSIINHEVAHYYWRGNEPWLNEGLANFITALHQSQGTGKPIHPASPPCADFTAIAQIPSPDNVHDCHYSLGERLFIDLYKTVGQKPFRQKLAQFYWLSQDRDADARQRIRTDIQYLEDQFTSSAARQVINRWYHGKTA